MRKSPTIVAAAGLSVALVLTGCSRTQRAEFSLERIARAGTTFQNPQDAIAGKGGATYFTADGPSGPGVFVASSVGEEARALATGRAFGRPVGIALSADMMTVFVADAQADAVFTVPASGGTPTVLPGTSGLRPRGLEVRGDRLYLTGVDPGSGTPSVLSLPAGGGPVTVLASGLVLPDGLAVRDDGPVFVTERFGGSVLRIANGSATPMPGISGVLLGQPAGLAVAPDGSGLLVSSLHPKDGTAQILIVDIASGATRIFDDVIGANRGAGGLHRAPDGSAYAWCDSTVGARGGVYRITA